MVKDFVVEWFCENSTMSKEELTGNLDINYFENSLIDSFAFLDLTACLEEKFNIEFTDDDFADDSFFTVSGLINIVEKRINND